MSRCRLTVINQSSHRSRYQRARLQQVLDAALIEAGIEQAALTVLLVDDAESQRLHGEHFCDPTPTDVMTFPDGGCDPRSGLLLLGDLAVGVEVAMREAEARGRRTADELTLYILHGLLHLTGYDDVTRTKQARMWAAQRRLLATVGIALESEPG